MNKEQIMGFAVMGAAVVLAGLGILMRNKGKKLLLETPDDKKAKRNKKLGTMLAVFGIWLFIVRLLPLVFGAPEKEGFHVAISPERVTLMGISLSSTVIVTWLAMGVLLVGAVLIRILVIPKMKDTPTGIQNVLELAVEGIHNYAQSKAHGLGENLSAYLFSVAALLVASAMVELFGLRAPTADITMTFALAFVTFLLINFYGIKRKGLGGRIKSLAEPTPVVFPLRVISDIAVPISMACRLFGNMLGGMIVMELLYNALGSNAVGIPSVIGLYFNVFHPLIQAYIFITLTLTFINEAAEIEAE